MQIYTDLCYCVGGSPDAPMRRSVALFSELQLVTLLSAHASGSSGCCDAAPFKLRLIVGVITSWPLGSALSEIW